MKNILKNKNKFNIKLMVSMLLMLLCLLAMPNSIEAATIDSTKALTTEWKIPAGGATITLPLSGTNLNVLVDWGDGSEVEPVISNYKTHKYTNTAETTYIIKVQYVSGTNLDWGYNASSSVTEGTTFYTYTKYLTKLTNWGDMPAIEYGFAYCENLEEVSGNVGDNTFIKVTDMSNMFYRAGYNVEVLKYNLGNIDTSNVTNMSQMFCYTGYSAGTWSVTGLNTWDTSSIESMSGMFYGAGYNARTFSLDLSSWNLSSLVDMSLMFYRVGYGATTWSIGDLSKWNISSVTNMSSMFSFAGYSARIWSMGDLSNWDTSSVTSMWQMFYYAGRSAETFSLNISGWDTWRVTNMSSMFESAGASATNWSMLISNKFTTNGATTTSMFASIPSTSKIILTSTMPSSDQFANASGEISNITFYVPNKGLAEYRNIWKSVENEKIKPIVEPIGDIEINMLKGYDYKEEGAAVAGYTLNESDSYTVYGYDLSISSDVNTKREGTYKVDYILTRTANGETNTSIATRVVNVYSGPILTLYKNNEIYDGNWTNQNIIGRITILSPETTSVVVKAGKSNWETNPSYAKVSYNGDEVYVIFDGSINADVYVREVDVNGKSTTFSSNGCAIKIDKEAPIIENITHVTEEKELLLRATAMDNESGVANYAIGDGINIPTLWKACTGEIEETLLSSGKYYLYVRDLAGNETITEEIIAIKDITPPTGNIEIIANMDENEDKYTNLSEVIINIDVEDNKTSKENILFAVYNKEDYQKVKNGEMEVTWKPYAESVEFTLDEADGEQIIYAVFKDEAGNVSYIEKVYNKTI